MNKKMIMAAIALSVTLLTAAPGMTRANRDQERPGRPGMHLPGAGVERLAKVLKLSAAQEEQIKAVQEAERPQMIKLMDEMKGKRQQLRQAEKGTTFNEESIRALATDISKIEIELTVSRVRTQNQINAVLTAEQLELLQNLRGAEGERQPPPPPAGAPGADN